MAKLDSKRTKKPKPSGGKPNSAFMKPLTPSPALAAVIGDEAMPRTEAVKKMWAYIKKYGLQEKRQIKTDDKLRAVFDGKETVDMFEMMKHLNRHLGAGPAEPQDPRPGRGVGTGAPEKPEPPPDDEGGSDGGFGIDP